MSAGASSPGPKDLHHDGRFSQCRNFRQSVIDVVKQGVDDIMLVAASSLEAVTAKGVFKKSHVTPAIRANDATDIWRARGVHLRQGIIQALPHGQSGALPEIFRPWTLLRHLQQRSRCRLRASSPTTSSAKTLTKQIPALPRSLQSQCPAASRPNRFRHSSTTIFCDSSRHDQGRPSAVPEDSLQWPHGHGRTCRL